MKSKKTTPSDASTNLPEMAPSTGSTSGGAFIRKPLSKKIRFEVFKRDNFKCQYCGKQVPDIVLEVDHIVPVCEGGTNIISNLVTSCYDCNHGKSGNKIQNKICRDDIKELTKQMKNKQEQLQEYHSLLKYEYELKTNDVKEVLKYFQDMIKWPNSHEESTLRQFINKLNKYELFEAIDIYKASRKYDFSYFCGICWNFIRKKEGK